MKAWIRRNSWPLLLSLAALLAVGTFKYWPPKIRAYVSLDANLALLKKQPIWETSSGAMGDFDTMMDDDRWQTKQELIHEWAAYNRIVAQREDEDLCAFYKRIEYRSNTIYVFREKAQELTCQTHVPKSAHHVLFTGGTFNATQKSLTGDH